MRTDAHGPDPGAGSRAGRETGTGPQPDAGAEPKAGAGPRTGTGRPATRTGGPPSTPTARPAKPARAGRVAVSVVFAVHGTASGTFATRIPWLREHLGLSPGWLGLALVFMTAGASAAMPLAARAAHRHGPRRALAAVSPACCAGLVLPPLAPALGWLCLALFLYGCGLGLMDVAMNAQGVRVEAEYGRSVMSSLHGLWSVGTLVGGAGGVLAAHAGLDARVHLGLAAPLLAAAAVVAARWTPDREPPGQPESARVGSAKREDEAPPRFAPPTRGVVAIGLLGFCAVFAEGASMDWSGIYLADVTGAGPGLAASAYTAFACTMALARLSGDAVVRRFGPVATVRAGGALAAAGGALVVAAHTPPAAVVGFALIGVGIAVVVPLCFAAAGRTAAAAPGQAIAGVATLAYASGLAAPAAVGWIAESTTLSASFGVVTVLLLGLVAGARVLRT
ncbi:MFS transporter [Streptomyces qinglanensis]|uniref:Fucose permease n=1 Tax=Streptomyces qinglanensis TaxID=943816 RepID=A0A1H9WAE3_9ACTN|nr:MFS transporter [Streptomyces qinglanensis]SES30741.1 Fucose permease [Streptomyces qinglanensis]